jgi:cytoskeletal protein RodZ
MAETDPGHSELASFGEELRREREIRGISLKEIADSTKISKRFLEAIERNDHRTLPAPVFTRGFVREYARYLGLNIDEMVNRYNYAAAGDDRIEKSAHLDRLVQPAAEQPREAKGIPPPYARVDRNIVFLIAIAIALVGVTWWALRFRRESRAEPIDTTSSGTTAPATPAPAAPKPVTAPPPVADDLLHLTIEVTGDSVVDLDVDGKRAFNDKMSAGDRKQFTARDTFRFRTIGNAGGVNLTINDVRVDSLGDDGRVLHDRIYDREWLAQHAPAGARGTP